MAKSITEREKTYTTGRPSVINDKVLQKLEDAFIMGCTDNEASLYAGISISTLYAYCDRYPSFKIKKEALKDSPTLKARKTVVESLDKPLNAQWYLERKKKDEFSIRREVTGEGGGAIMIGSLLDSLEKPIEMIEKDGIYQQIDG
jgi:hypothetical protein